MDHCQADSTGVVFTLKESGTHVCCECEGLIDKGVCVLGMSGSEVTVTCGVVIVLLVLVHTCMYIIRATHSSLSLFIEYIGDLGTVPLLAYASLSPFRCSSLTHFVIIN